MKKFNIAYIPVDGEDRFFSLASTCKNAHSYLILPRLSIPHLTVCQFYADEDCIEDLYQEILMLGIPSKIDIKFNDYSFLSFDDVIHWASLLPENNEVLHEVFGKVSGLVKRIRTDDYDPHMTLFNYKQGTKFELPRSILPIIEGFELVIGESDDVGQLVSVVAQQSSREYLPNFS